MSASSPQSPIPEFNPSRGLRFVISDDRLSAKMSAKIIYLMGGYLNHMVLLEFIEATTIHKDRYDMKAIEAAAKQIEIAIKDPNQQALELEFIIANGNPAKQGKNGWIKFFFQRAQRVVLKEDGSADFRNINKYVHINEGDKLASLFEGIAGEQGIDVEGKPIHPNPIERPKMTLGKNVITKTIEDPEYPGQQIKEFYAALSGVVFATDASITVSPELNIDSSIGLGTGNVNFDGTIRVKGTIEEGAVLNCTGSLFLEGNVESSEVTVGENLDVKGGVKGKGKGVIRVKGDLHTKFIENAIIEIDGDCLVENFILGSTIHCMGNIVLTGESSSLIGSEVLAYKGITLASFGSSAQLDTTIEVGFHYKNDRMLTEGTIHLTQLEKELEAVLPEILKIKSVIQRTRGGLDEERKQKFKDVFDSYQKKAKTLKLLQAKMEELRGSRFNHDNVKVVVRNTAHPGAVIKYKKQMEKIVIAQSAFVMNFFPNQEKALMTGFKSK